MQADAQPSLEADAFLERWRQRDAAFRLAELYAPAHSFACALGLVLELNETLFCLSDRRVAEHKLGWWMEEAAQAAAGQARHPLTRALVAAHRGATLLPLAAAALRLFEAPTPVDRAALQQARAGWLQALHGLYGGAADSALLAAQDDQLRLLALGQGGVELCSPLTLADWAALGLTRATLPSDAAALAALRQRLARQWLSTPPPATGSDARALHVHAGLLRASLLARGEAPRPGLLLAWRAWRLARQLRAS